MLLNIFKGRDINAGVRNWRDTKDSVLLDVRTEEEYAEGHIKGSLNVPLGRLSDINMIVKNKDVPLFVHCYSGARSARAAAYLRGLGYVSVENIGGINKYKGNLII